MPHIMNVIKRIYGFCIGIKTTLIVSGATLAIVFIPTQVTAQALLYNDLFEGNQNRVFDASMAGAASSQWFGTCFTPPQDYLGVNRIDFGMSVPENLLQYYSLSEFDVQILLAPECGLTGIPMQTISLTNPFPATSTVFAYSVPFSPFQSQDFLNGLSYNILFRYHGSFATTSVQGLSMRTFNTPDRTGINEQLFKNSLTNPTVAVNSGSFLSFALYQEAPNTQTRIVSQTSPANGALATSTQVFFGFNYYNNPTSGHVYAGVQIRNLSLGGADSEITQPILGSAFQNFSNVTTLPAGNLYMWRPFLSVNETSSNRIYGQWQSFDVVTRSAESSPLPSLDFGVVASTTEYLETFCNGFGSSTAPIYTALGFQYSSCYALGFLFVPSNASVSQYSQLPYQLVAQFPFSYFGDIQTVLTSSSSASTTIPALQVFLPLVGTTTLFSQDTLKYFIKPSVSDGLRTVSSAALWFLFVYSCWVSILGFFKRQES